MSKSFVNHNLDNSKLETLNWAVIQTEMRNQLGNEIYESWLKKINF